MENTSVNINTGHNYKRKIPVLTGRTKFCINTMASVSSFPPSFDLLSRIFLHTPRESVRSPFKSFLTLSPFFAFMLPAKSKTLRRTWRVKMISGMRLTLLSHHTQTRTI